MEEGGALGGARVGAGLGELPCHLAEVEVEGDGVPRRVEDEGAVEVARPAAHGEERLAAAGRAAGDVRVARLAAVADVRESHGDVVGLLEGVTGEVAQGLVVEREASVAARRGAGLVAGIAAVGDVALGQRGLAGRWAGRDLAQARDDRAVRAAATEEHRAVVPASREVDLEADRWGRLVDGVDFAGDLAVRAGRWGREGRCLGDRGASCAQADALGRDLRALEGRAVGRL